MNVPLLALIEAHYLRWLVEPRQFCQTLVCPRVCGHCSTVAYGTGEASLQAESMYVRHFLPPLHVRIREPNRPWVSKVRKRIPDVAEGRIADRLREVRLHTGTDVAAVAAIDQLTLENRRLAEEVEKLKKDSKAAALNSQGSFTTVHVPGQ